MTTPRIRLFATLVTVWAISPAATTDSDITVKPIGNNQYELTRTSNIPDLVAAQRALLPKAKELCGDQPVNFGHYSFDSTVPLTDSKPDAPPRLRLTQTVQCGATTPTPVPQITNAPDGWQPTPEDRTTVERQTYRYLSSKTAGDYTAAYAMFSDSMKGATHFDTWQTQTQSFNANAGQLLSRHVRKITWYKDPPSAPLPGIYVAVDYSSEFDQVPIHCGYVAWYRGPNGDYQVIHEEENSIDKSSIAKKPADVATLAAKFGCSAQ
jgi:Protein of unknown function (DUF4019)